LIGQFLEVGPLRMDRKNKLALNRYSWLPIGNLLFIDQPVGTGYSYTEGRMDSTDESVNRHFLHFLQKFLKTYRKYVSKAPASGMQVSRDIYFAGESHAGHFMISMIRQALAENMHIKDGGTFLTIKGVAIGNGWIDPRNQYDVSDYAFKHKLISASLYERLKIKAETCRGLLRLKRYNHAVCFQITDDVLSASAHRYMRVLSYDIRKRVRSEAFYPAGHERFESYLNNGLVKRALHVYNLTHRFGQCLDPPYYALKHLDGKGVIDDLVHILHSSRVRVLFYTGEYDMVCNHISLHQSLTQMKWKGTFGWKNSKETEWLINNNTAGSFHQYGNLKSLVVHNAGHMVPLEAPTAAYELMREFVDNSLNHSFETKINGNLKGTMERRRNNNLSGLVGHGSDSRKYSNASRIGLSSLLLPLVYIIAITAVCVFLKTVFKSRGPWVVRKRSR
jgi:carboxypeptidase D